MKKEIRALLEKEEGTLKLNPLFTLRRSHTHAMRARLVGTNICMNIEDEDFLGIKSEIEAAMREMMADYTDEIVRKFDGGVLNERGNI